MLIVLLIIYLFEGSWVTKAQFTMEGSLKIDPKLSIMMKDMKHQ
jgi:hypothetical protein